MVAQHKEQLDAINKNIGRLEEEVCKLRGESDEYGDEKVILETPKMGDTFRVLRGGKA